MDRDGSATTGRDDNAGTTTRACDATSVGGELADLDALAATKEIEAVHRADEAWRHGDA